MYYAVGWAELPRSLGFCHIISRRDPPRHCRMQVLENEHHPALFITPLKLSFSLAFPSISVIISTEHVTIRLQTHSGSITSSIDNPYPILTKQMPSRDWLRWMSTGTPVSLSLSAGPLAPKWRCPIFWRPLQRSLVESNAHIGFSFWTITGLSVWFFL